MDALTTIIERKRSELKKRVPSRLNRKSKTSSLKGALKKKGLAVIAEIKRKSPSAGHIAKIEDPAKLAKEYARGGAAAISVLTDEPSFGGSFDDLAAVSAAVDVPCLCKDFIIDTVQLDMALDAGASAVLLIARVLGKKLGKFLDEAETRGLEALVEVHNEAECNLAIAAGAEIIGVNNRDLSTFEVDLSTAQRLIQKIPQEKVRVAESGILTIEDAHSMGACGYDAVLIGQTLVQAENRQEMIEEIGKCPTNIL